MKRILTTLLLCAIVPLTSCGKKEEPVKKEPTQTKVPFTPNGSGIVSPIQAKFWFEANGRIDSLSEAYSKLLSNPQDSSYNTNLNNFIAERDAICKESGISGGYKEYSWISKNITKSVNKPLLDSLNIKTF